MARIATTSARNEPRSVLSGNTSTVCTDTVALSMLARRSTKARQQQGTRHQPHCATGARQLMLYRQAYGASFRNINPAHFQRLGTGCSAQGGGDATAGREQHGCGEVVRVRQDVPGGARMDQGGQPQQRTQAPRRGDQHGQRNRWRQGGRRHSGSQERVNAKGGARTMSGKRSTN
jgi:hypothetical protein